MDSKDREKLTVIEHFVPNNDGWLLHLKQVIAPTRLRKDRRPFIIIPGYGMNSFAFGYSPKGDSLERAVAEAGYEFWSLDLRKQGNSRPVGHKQQPPTLRDFADIDLPAALDHIVASTRTDHRTVTLAGCSLGGTIAFTYLALTHDQLIHSMISLCSPLRWVHVPPLLRVAMASPRLLRCVPVRGSRRMARYAFPIAGRVPRMLDIYANPKNIDLSDIKELARSVEDPSPSLNAEIAQWMKDGDLTIRDINITQAMSQQTMPLLVVSSNRDGIVPPATARFVRHIWGGEDIDELIVGDETHWYSHADVFVGKNARKDVFDPLVDWLLRNEEDDA